MSAVVGLYGSLTPSFLHTLLGLSSLALAGTVTFVLMLASVLTQLGCHSLNSRKAGVSGLLIVTAGLIVVTAAAAVWSLALPLAGSVIAGIGQGLAFMGLLAGVSDSAPDDQRGEVVSTFLRCHLAGRCAPGARRRIRGSGDWAAPRRMDLHRRDRRHLGHSGQRSACSNSGTTAGG